MSSKPLALLGSEIVLDVLDFLESNNIREVFRESGCEFGYEVTLKRIPYYPLGNDE